MGCFCTLALGKKYRALATLLAKDLAIHAPGYSLVVLTDGLSSFKADANVIAIHHKQQSVGCYHDKRFVIQAALARFDSCIFMDADMRIVGDVPQDLQWRSGITARTGSEILKHNQNRTKALAVIKQLAHKWDLNLEAVQYVNEFLFTVSKDAGRETEFLDYWAAIAPCFELQGVYDGEGSAIGLAAARAGLAVQFDRHDRFPFFKDRIEKVRISTGEAGSDEKLAYFNEQKRYEYPDRSPIEKLSDKLGKNSDEVLSIDRFKSLYSEEF